MNDDQDVQEEFVPEDGEGNVQGQAARLKEKLKAAEEKAKEYLDNWQRAQADFVNLRKRDEEEMQRREKYAAAPLVQELMPVIHSLEQLAAHDKNSEPVLSQFMAALKKMGVSAIDPLGEAFDPMKHEAIKNVPTNDLSKDHTVAEVLERGYMLHDRVLRPARVAVFTMEG